MTRKTFFRVLLALMNWRDTHVMRWLLPRRMTKLYFNPAIAAIFRVTIARWLDGVKMANLVAREFCEMQGKIGDTINVRRPQRFA